MNNRIEAAHRFSAENRHDQAIRELRAVISVDPRHREARVLLGLEYQKKADFASALRELMIARELDPADRDIEFLIGNVEQCRGNLENAEEHYRRSLGRNSSRGRETHVELGKIAERKKEYRRAAEEYEQANKRGFDRSLALRSISLNRVCGNREKALSLIRGQMETVDPADVFTRNILCNEREILDGKLVLSSRPRSMAVTLTSRCNLDCVMCEAKTTAWDIPEETLREVTGFFPYLEHIMWQGGEIFLLDRFRDILRESKKYPRMRQIIVSNGAAFDRAVIEELVTLPNAVLSISVDAAQKELLEKIRRGIRWETLLGNLRLIRELKAKHSSPMKLHMNVTVMRSNHRQLVDLVEFAGEQGFDYVFLAPVHGNEDSGENIFLSRDCGAFRHLEETVGEIERKARERGVVLHNWLPVRAAGATAGDSGSGGVTGNRGLLCYAPWQRVFVNWRGDLFPDCPCPQEHAAGNLEEYTIAGIWNSPGMQKYRQKIRDNDGAGFCRPSCIAGKIEHLI